KILDDTTSVIGDTLDLAVGGYKGLAAAITGNEEALKNVRNEYRGTVNDFKKWASDTAQSALNGASGVERLNDALLRAIKGTEKGPRKVTWLDQVWGRATSELKELHGLMPARDSMLGFPGATDRLKELGVPLEVLNRAIGRNLVDIPKLQDAL